MPCGDTRILTAFFTAFFDDLADRAVRLSETGSVDSTGDEGLRFALHESRTVLDVLSEIAALLEIDLTGLERIVAGVVPATARPAAGAG